ncbi:hypothetical protein ACP70R_024235 [Stipagrostis hirtigluma subsp. patula]
MAKQTRGTAAPAASRRKRKRGASTAAASSGGAGMCDDVLRGIFARLPARDAVASMALSKHHRRMVRCPEFRSLHCRLGPPLPRPHIAYVATAKIARSTAARGPVAGLHGFHVAGAGLSGNAPIRALSGGMYLHNKHVNTCNGVVLLAGAPMTTCVLWNPAVADKEMLVTIPVPAGRAPASKEWAILGLGYGPRSNTYKLLLSHRLTNAPSYSSGDARYPKELLVYTLGVAGEQPPLRTLSSPALELDGEISDESLYIDGTIYVLHVKGYIKSEILAFDVDEETVTAIDLPSKRNNRYNYDMTGHPMSKLMELSGRPCVAVKVDITRGLWLLTADHQWERRCVINKEPYSPHEDNLDHWSVIGVWDCGGALVLYLHLEHRADNRLYLYHDGAKKMVRKDLPCNLTPERTFMNPEGEDYRICWGYKPTLVSPESIAGEINEGEAKRQHFMADIMEAWKPANEQDRKKGLKANLGTVCFMEFLVRIIRKLPDNMQDMIEMPLHNS